MNLPISLKDPQAIIQALLAVLAVIGVIVGVVAGVEGSSKDERPAEQPVAEAPVEAQAGVLGQLAELEVKGRAPKTGYDRALFGQAWSDDVEVEFGHNGCDTRNDILRRDLRDITLKPNTNDCVVLTGFLDDPFTGKQIYFERGVGTSNAVQIDHVVPLSDAWQKGAQQWDTLKRRNFANDPRNLMAVDGPTNGSKGDRDFATWQPPNKAFRCEYATRIVNVKHIYGVWVTQAEHDALKGVLVTCAA